jgi:hypothetical protein
VSPDVTLELRHQDGAIVVRREGPLNEWTWNIPATDHRAFITAKEAPSVFFTPRRGTLCLACRSQTRSQCNRVPDRGENRGLEVMRAANERCDLVMVRTRGAAVRCLAIVPPAAPLQVRYSFKVLHLTASQAPVEEFLAADQQAKEFLQCHICSLMSPSITRPI